jgi:anti-anti-sigma factor
MPPTSAEESAIGADYIRVSSVACDPACVIEVSGELNLITEREFAVRAAEVLAACRGPVLFDLSGLDFLDCRGARALARAVGSVPSPGAELHGCKPLVCRVLDVLGFDLPYRPESVGETPATPRPPARSVTLTRGERLVAMAHAAESNARQSALYGSEVMSRLAATYSQLALNSRYRIQGKSEDRGRLLALSGRALDLSEQYMRHAASDAG